MNLEIMSWLGFLSPAAQGCCSRFLFFFPGCWELNSGPHITMGDTLPTEPISSVPHIQVFPFKKEVYYLLVVDLCVNHHLLQVELL